MISLVQNLKCISRLDIHYYHNRRHKSHIISLKAVIVGKSLISAGLDIDRILYFVFMVKHLPTTLGQETLATHFVKIPINFKKWGGRCYTPTPARHALAARSWLKQLLESVYSWKKLIPRLYNKTVVSGILQEELKLLLFTKFELHSCKIRHYFIKKHLQKCATFAYPLESSQFKVIVNVNTQFLTFETPP